MPGRVIKFNLDYIGSIDSFINDVVYQRQNKDIYLKPRKIKLNSLNKDDLIFFQSNGYISHYTSLSEDGPTLRHNVTEEFPVKISINNVIKMDTPLNSEEYQIFGQGYNKLSDEMIKELLANEEINDYTSHLYNDEVWFNYFTEQLNDDINIDNIFNLIPEERISYIKYDADLQMLPENIMIYFLEMFRGVSYTNCCGGFIPSDEECDCDLY